MGHPTPFAKQYSRRRRPTAASRSSPPWSEAEGSAAAAGMSEAKRSGATGDRGSSRRAVAGTPKGAAGPARHVPGRARNEPGRADDVTGQTSDRRCATKARATARCLRGRFDSNPGLPGHSAPISRQRDGAVHRRMTRVGGRRYSRQRLGVISR